jgi:hypothetical protein
MLVFCPGSLAKLLDGVKARKWNSEQFIVYGLVILQRGDATIKSAKAIIERLTSSMDTWDKGSTNILVHVTEAQLLRRQDGQSPEQ